MLSLLLHQTARIPVDPSTKKPISDAKERIELLISELAKAKETILIPAPALAEFLVVVEEAGPGYIQTIDKKASFEVAEFDEKAAIEAADIIRAFVKEFGHKKGPGEGDWQKVKVDQQIVAIAKAEAADCLYCADRGMVKMAVARKVKAIALWDLPSPESRTPLLDLAREDSAKPSGVSTAPAPPSAHSPVVPPTKA
jgi:hypothetical protein